MNINNFVDADSDDALDLIQNKEIKDSIILLRKYHQNDYIQSNEQENTI